MYCNVLHDGKIKRLEIISKKKSKGQHAQQTV